MAWTDPFDDPIELADGGRLLTLSDARAYVLDLPKRDQDNAAWQTAIEMLLLVAEGRGPVMFADIAMRRALNHDKPSPAPAPRRKRAKAYRILETKKAR